MFDGMKEWSGDPIAISVIVGTGVWVEHVLRNLIILVFRTVDIEEFHKATRENRT